MGGRNVDIAMIYLNRERSGIYISPCSLLLSLASLSPLLSVPLSRRITPDTLLPSPNTNTNTTQTPSTMAPKIAILFVSQPQSLPQPTNHPSSTSPRAQQLTSSSPTNSTPCTATSPLSPRPKPKASEQQADKSTSTKFPRLSLRKS